MNKFSKNLIAGLVAAAFIVVSQPSMAKRYSSGKRYTKSSYSKRYMPATRTQTNSAYGSASSNQFNSANYRTYQNQQTMNNRTASQTASQSNMRSNLLSGAAGVAGGYLLSQALSDHGTQSAGYANQANPTIITQRALSALQQSTQALFNEGKLSKDEMDSIEFYRSKIENVLTPHLQK